MLAVFASSAVKARTVFGWALVHVLAGAAPASPPASAAFPSGAFSSAGASGSASASGATPPSSSTGVSLWSAPTRMRSPSMGELPCLRRRSDAILFHTKLWYAWRYIDRMLCGTAIIAFSWPASPCRAYPSRTDRSACIQRGNARSASLASWPLVQVARARTASSFSPSRGFRTRSAAAANSPRSISRPIAWVGMEEDPKRWRPK
mmetsp:Transcript_47482/g.113039  ORF Transcript_47482/g.113039 Transcript_47482/m.113039 type:complete len:205 (-) Transcript_47482:432-1046(-)